MVFIIVQGYGISKFLYGEDATVNNDIPFQILEQTGAIRGHMVQTGEWMESSFNLVLQVIIENRQALMSRRRRNLEIESGSSDDAESIQAALEGKVLELTNSVEARVEEAQMAGQLAQLEDLKPHLPLQVYQARKQEILNKRTDAKNSIRS